MTGTRLDNEEEPGFNLSLRNDTTLVSSFPKVLARGSGLYSG